MANVPSRKMLRIFAAARERKKRIKLSGPVRQWTPEEIAAEQHRRNLAAFLEKLECKTPSS